MFWNERQLPQGQDKVDFVHDLAGSCCGQFAASDVFVFLGPQWLQSMKSSSTLVGPDFHSRDFEGVTVGG